ncbi:TPA: hypothetical protein ACIPB6_003622, partial [Salmonella enterica subsp. diarizonae serovar 50:k:z35]
YVFSLRAATFAIRSTCSKGKIVRCFLKISATRLRVYYTFIFSYVPGIACPLMVFVIETASA